MFPHMYKVRPGKSQQVKSPTMSADCDKWQADSWRRNSQKWGSQGWEGEPPSPGVPQTPPPIPAPPPDPQDNLTKDAASGAATLGNSESCNNSTAETAHPWRRSRSRTNSPPKFELSAPPTGRSRRSRNVVHDSNCPTGDASPPARRRSRPPIDEAPNGTEGSSSVPLRRRRGQEENEIQNEPSQQQENQRSSSPPVRRRTRETSIEQNNASNHTSNEESNAYPVRRRSRSRALQSDQTNGSCSQNTNNEANYTIRTRSRSRALQAEENANAPEDRNAPSSSPPARRRSRVSNQQESNETKPQHEKSSTPPLRLRVRTPSVETNSLSQSGEEETQAPSTRRRSRPVINEDDSNSVTEIVTIRRRVRKPVNDEDKSRTDEEEDQRRTRMEPQMVIEAVNGVQPEQSPEPEICRSTLQVELKSSTTNVPSPSANMTQAAQGKEVGSSQEQPNKEHEEESTATVVIRRRPTSSNRELEKSRSISEDKDFSAGNQLVQDTQIEAEPPTTVIVRSRRSRSNSRNVDRQRTPEITVEASISSIPHDMTTSNFNLGESDEAVLIRPRSAASSTGKADRSRGPSEEMSDFSASHRRHSDANSHEEDVTIASKRDVTTPTNDEDDEEPMAATVVIRRRRPEKEIIISDDGVEYVHENDKPKHEEDEWATEEPEKEDCNMEDGGWSNNVDETETGIEDINMDDVGWASCVDEEEVKKDKEPAKEESEDEVSKATRLWLEAQNALLAPPKPMKIIYLTEEELQFDPLQQAAEEEKVSFNSGYEPWDAEPADQEPTPEFLKKKLKKVEAQNSLTPLKIESRQREKSPVTPTPARRRRGSSPSKAEDELRTSSARVRKNKAEEGSAKDQKVLETTAMSAIPPPPPPPPPAPKSSKVPLPPPPPPTLQKIKPGKNKARVEMVEQIKKAARTRPDWHSVMKDIEGGIKLRKVGNDLKSDRSQPILPNSRGKGGKFVYESEKPMMHNEMLEEIQRGVRLRHVRTNDRSRPDFNKLGIRKIRRQVTVEEKKSVDPDTPEALPSSSDEEEDIDQMRDDLQSTKTQLAEEIKKTKKIERENKILKIDMESLQAEVKRMKRRLKESGIHEAKPLANGEADAIAPKLSKSMSKLRMREEDLDFSELDNIEEDIKILNEQIEAQRKRAEQAEQRCEELTQKMKVAENTTEEWEMRSIYFEKKFKSLQKDQGIELPDINCIGTQTEAVEISTHDGPCDLPTKKSQSRKSFGKLNRMESFKEEEEDSESSSEEEEESVSDHNDDEEEDGHDDMESEEEEGDEEKAERKAENESIKRERELNLYQNKLCHATEKLKNVKRERNNLRDRINKYYKDMRKEREEYLKVKAELRDLADQMKDEESLVDDVYDETDDSAEDSSKYDDDISDDDAQKKPKKLRKRRRRKVISEDKQEEMLHNDEPDDLCDLVDPEWPTTDEEESEPDNDDDDIKTRIKRAKDKLERQEQVLNDKKKDNYMLKSQIDQCDEQYGEERRRNARINTELQFLFADI